MNFNCIELLGLTNNFNFLGELFNYRNVQSFTIKGKIDGSKDDNDIEPIWTEMFRLTGFTGYEDIYLNSCLLGYGRLVSINFAESTDVINREYTANIEILKAGNLYNMTGDYAGIYNILQTNGMYINSISQAQNISSVGKDQFNEEISISLEIDDSFPGERSELAKNIYSAFIDDFTYKQIINSIHPNYWASEGIKYNSETYNDILGSYSFNTSFTYLSGSDYTWDYTIATNYKDSEVSVREDGKIKASRYNTSSLLRSNYADIDLALNGWGIVKTGTYERCNLAYLDYINNFTGLGFSGDCDTNLNNYLISSKVVQNVIIGQIDYSHEYSNSKIYESGFYHSYSTNITYQEDGYVQLTLVGEIKGTGRDRSEVFVNVYNDYQSVKSGIHDAAFEDYTQYWTSSQCKTGELTLVSTEESYSEYNSNITYSYNFTDSPYYVDDSDYMKIKPIYDVSEPLNIVNHFNIVNEGVVSQSSNQSTRGTFSNNVEIVYKNDKSVQELILKAKDFIIEPTGDDTILIDLNYSLVPQRKSFNLSAVYSYNGYRSMEDILI